MTEASSQTGKFVWYEYMGNDLRAAVDFYTGVVGWSAKDAGMGFDTRRLVTRGGAGEHLDRDARVGEPARRLQYVNVHAAGIAATRCVERRGVHAQHRYATDHGLPSGSRSRSPPTDHA